MIVRLLLVIATLQLLGCALTYSQGFDGKKSLSAGFNPTIYDYKAIKELTR